MEKTKVTSDFLYKYLTEHDITISKIAETMGASVSIVTRGFRHGLDRLGKTINFSPSNLEKLNKAIEQIARELRERQVTFGSEQTYTNMRGKTYDPGTVPDIQALGEYFNMTKMTERILGWNLARKRTTLSIQKSPVYGNVTQEDVDRINAELLAVAGVLSSYEVVPDEKPRTTDTDAPTTAGTRQQKNGSCADKEANEGTGAQAWDNTSLPLHERTRLWREHRQDGILLFRVNDGYTAEGDDAMLLHDIDSSIIPYTDTATGMTTAYMDASALEQVLQQLAARNRCVMFSDMY